MPARPGIHLLPLLLLLCSCSIEEAPPRADLGAATPDTAPADTITDTSSDLSPDTGGDSATADLAPTDLAAADASATDAFPQPKPDSCLGAACGVVVDVHGLTMNARMQDNNTNMRALGKKYGYIVVQPNAKGNPPLTAWTPLDDAKVLAFIKRVLAVWHADKKRVHFTGFSQGGAMSWRFLCKHGDLLASVAPAAACTATDPLVGCFGAGKKPKHQIPVLFMHGTKDTLANFSCAKKVRDAVVAAWQLKQTKVVSQDSAHQWTRHAGPKGAVFEFVRHDYAAKSLVIGGHCYPGSKDHSGGVSGQLFGFACAGANAFTWGEIAMKFFVAHPK